MSRAQIFPCKAAHWPRSPIAFPRPALTSPPCSLRRLLQYIVQKSWCPSSEFSVILKVAIMY
ncbi:hypothetical protein OH77DRAFT_1191007 [Trametes cingulata]|nr:hypothetical protein OH77DRAFT_1191007 [Trametes cingulata]